MRKTLHWLLSITFLAQFAVVPAFATDSMNSMYHQPVATVQTHSVPVGIKTELKMGDHMSSGSGLDSTSLSSLHQRCDTEITNRVTSLTAAISRVNDIKRLSTDQKNQYTTSLQSTITGLTAVKAKCDADTDATTLLSDMRSVITNYRVYAQYLPQTAVLTATDRIKSIIEQLTTLSTKLQERINKAQTNGKNVTNLQAWLTDMQTKLTDASTQLSTVAGLVTPLQPTTFNKQDNRSTFLSAHTDLKAVVLDLEGAYKDAKQIITELKAFGDNVPSGTVTPSVAVSPTSDAVSPSTTSATTQP